MMLSGKVKGALAWGGLALILAVPSADIISARLGGGAAQPVAGEPVTEITTASVDGVKTVVPVIKALPTPLKGKPMPDYITDDEAPAEAETAPVVVKPATSATPPATQTAVVAPPQPMPAHMRPLPPASTTTAPPQSSATMTTTPVLAPVVTPPQTDVATVQQPMTPTQPLVLDEQQVMANEAALNPPAQSSNVPRPPAMVGEDDLQEWDSGSLADYLERKGLISDATYTEETVGEDDEYDEDGFFLSDGPNQPRRNRRNVENDDSFIVFPFN